MMRIENTYFNVYLSSFCRKILHFTYIINNAIDSSIIGWQEREHKYEYNAIKNFGPIFKVCFKMPPSVIGCKHT